jgi:prepilin-type N-terminal cleavage/methylation domain-containing protein/prepilin-type processing-associated H-X9-DG protein
MRTSHIARQRARRGFTLIELLVVVAIIAALIAILLPAVQAARAEARRTQSRNNLKQVGLALHNYHETHAMFPAGWIGIDAGVPAVEGQNGYGWGSMLLPFVDQAPLFNKIDFKLPINDPANLAASLSFLPVFRSASDVGPSHWKIESEVMPGTVLATLPTANFVGNFGTRELEDCHSLSPGEACKSDGIFYHNSTTRIRDVLDGTSNTFAIGERKTNADLGWFSTWVGAVPEGEEHLARILGVTDHTPNHPDAHFDDFSSYDEGGVHFVFCDGHVRFISEVVNLTVYQGLATRAGSEVVDGEF